MRDSKPFFIYSEYFPNTWLFPCVHGLIGVLLIIWVICAEKRTFTKIINGKDNSLSNDSEDSVLCIQDISKRLKGKKIVD